MVLFNTWRVRQASQSACIMCSTTECATEVQEQLEEEDEKVEEKKKRAAPLTAT